MNSIHLGWSPFFENQLTSGDQSRYSVGRILDERKDCYVLSIKDGREMRAALAGNAAYLGPGQTSVLLGSSGVGKSTLVNRILGEERQEVREVRSRDDRGRHTTTSRQLLFLPEGGMLIDTPGMRELQLWDADEAIRQTFRDVEAAASRCRFTDCGHHAGTPGCGVQSAIESGALPPERAASWSKLGRELTSLDRKKNKKAQSKEKERWKAIKVAAKEREPEEEAACFWGTL